MNRLQVEKNKGHAQKMQGHDVIALRPPKLEEVGVALHQSKCWQAEHKSYRAQDEPSKKVAPCARVWRGTLGG